MNSLFAPLEPDEMAAYVAIDGKLAARIVLRDVPRENAKSSLEKLHRLGVKKLSMLTGDKEASARIIAGEVGIDDVQSELFPKARSRPSRTPRKTRTKTSRRGTRSYSAWSANP